MREEWRGEDGMRRRGETEGRDKRKEGLKRKGKCEDEEEEGEEEEEKAGVKERKRSDM